MTLQSGDVLLYGPVGAFGWAIRVKTWHPIAHVEVYDGCGLSVASRDRLGVNRYPFRREQLVSVCRARRPYDITASRLWFERHAKGLPYGYLDLLQFFGLPVDGKGMICSTFGALYVRAGLHAGEIDPFNGEPATKIAPFEFALTPFFEVLPWEN